MQTLAYFAGYILRENLLSAKSHFSIKKMQRSFRFWKLFVRIVALLLVNLLGFKPRFT